MCTAERARSARNAEKARLLDAGDQGGLDAWHEREKQFRFPYTEGQMEKCTMSYQSRERL